WGANSAPRRLRRRRRADPPRRVPRRRASPFWRCPGRPTLLDERAEALLRLGALALPCNDPAVSPLGGAMRRTADLANDLFRGARSRRPGRQQVAYGRVDSRIKCRLAFD